MLASPTVETATSAKAGARRNYAFAGAVLGAVFVALIAMTWRRWPDLLVDFGVQLYVPWKLSTGAVLYRDVAYLTGGPLSQYFDALIFRIFGASVLTLVISNLAILAALLAVVYRAFYRASDQLTALMAGLAILLVFAFAQYSEFGIFNYVTPYSEEIYQGLALAVLGVSFLSQWVTAPDKRTALATGLCVGLVFLTKAEVFLALAAVVAAALLIVWRRAGASGASMNSLGLMALAGAAPPLGFFLYFWRHGSLAQSIGWTCWAWTPLLTTTAADSPFYRWCLGLDAPLFYVKQMLIQFFAVVLIVAVCAAVFRRWREGWRAGVGWLALAALLAWPAWVFKWEECGRCLPLVCLVTLPLLWWSAQKTGWTPSLIFAGLWTVFSLALLAKLGFNSRIWHYGFALAMPAFLAAVYVALRLVPDVLEDFGAPPHLLRTFLCVFLALGFCQLILGSKYIYQKKTVMVGSGADQLWTFPPEDDPMGVCVAGAMDWMEANTPTNATVAALPAGAMLNFLLRRANPSGYLRWNPPELAAFGEANMTRAFEEHPPDYVLLLGVDNSEFGVRYFGDTPGFGRDLIQWINGHYRPVALIGNDWSQDGQFGITILQRK